MLYPFSIFNLSSSGPGQTIRTTYSDSLHTTIHDLASQYISTLAANLHTTITETFPTHHTSSPFPPGKPHALTTSHLQTGRRKQRRHQPPHPYRVQQTTKVKEIIRDAWKPSTRNKYSNAVHQFLDYCYINAIPSDEVLPASESLLCKFAVSFAGRLAGKSVSAKCDGIRAWHIENGYSYQGGQQLNYVIKGIENRRPLSSFRPKRPPISGDMLTCLERNLDWSSPSDRCIFFVALACFWGQVRLGEFLPLLEKKFDSSLYPSWDDLKPPTTSSGSRTLHLPNTKMGGRHGEDVILSRQDHIDPIKALTLHHATNFSSSSQSIASYRSASGSITVLTQRKFLGRINAILRQNKFPVISGHCFRISGTTHLLLAGIPPDIVKILGRWASDAFLRYWRHIELIAPLYIEFLAPIMQDAGLLRRIAS